MNDFQQYASLEEFLRAGSDKDFPIANQTKNYIDRYTELNRKFSMYPVEMGAMKAEFDQWRTDLSDRAKAINEITDLAERIRQFSELIDEDTAIFLNKHGAEHTQMVRDKALEILKCFNRDYPSHYETFLLLCSISTHDIGNLYGRNGHERKIRDVLDNECANIIDDSIEKVTISRIAGVHGGKIKGNKDTISNLQLVAQVNNKDVREQMLAAVLRFADELSDDASRANYPAMTAGILGEASEIFHVYSSKLHTVKLQRNPVGTWDIILRYDMDEDTAKKKYKKLGKECYLLDEIYERTFKMENERRYCNRFLRPYCAIERINVEITIERDDVFDPFKINYTLEEKGYPEQSYSTIEELDNEYLLTGEEMAEKLSRNDDE